MIRDGAKLVEDAADVLVELSPLLQLAAEPEDSAEESPAETVPLATRPGYAELLAALGFDTLRNPRSGPANRIDGG